MNDLDAKAQLERELRKYNIEIERASQTIFEAEYQRDSWTKEKANVEREINKLTVVTESKTRGVSIASSTGSGLTQAKEPNEVSQASPPNISRVETVKGEKL
jgi:TolA-binding protein